MLPFSFWGHHLVQFLSSSHTRQAQLNEWEMKSFAFVDLELHLLDTCPSRAQHPALHMHWLGESQHLVWWAQLCSHFVDAKTKVGGEEKGSLTRLRLKERSQ